MKSFKHFLALSLFIIFATACKSDPLEEYFVKATESPDFFVVNIPASIVQFDEKKLDTETKRQIESIKKINILVYKNDFDKEKKAKEYKKARHAIESKAYKTLTKINNQGYDVSFAYQGSPGKIDEVILLGKDKNYNFIIGMIKGKGVNINNISKALKHIKDVDESQAKTIIDMIKTTE
jgi:hypothetical protein